MKNIKKLSIIMLALLVLITMFSSTALCYVDQYNNSASLILSIPFEDSGIKVTALQDQEEKGPQSFFINDNKELYICDTLNSRILKYFDSKLAKEIKIDHYRDIIDMYVNQDGVVFLLDEAYKVLAIDNDGKLLNSYSIPKIEENCSNMTLNGRTVKGFFEPIKIREEKGELIVAFTNKKEYVLRDNELINVNPSGYIAALDNNNAYIKEQITGEKIKFNTTGKAVEIYVLKKDNINKNVFIKFNSLYEDENTKKSVLEETVKIINNNKITATAELLENEFYTPNTSIRITENNDLYQMVVDKECLNVYKVNFIKNYISKIERYKNSKTNNELLSGSEVNTFIPLSKSYQAFTKSQVLDRLEYNTVDTYWTYNSSDNGDKSVTSTPGYVTQPDWLRDQSLNDGNDHTVEGFPYCWGGWCGDDTHSDSRWTDFYDGISEGYYAGNVHTLGHGYIGGTVGTDCSGFVSSVFDLPYKHSTNTLVSGGDPFHSISKNSAEYLDIFDKTSSHVVIAFMEDTYGGVSGWWCYESTTGGDDKVQLKFRSDSWLSSYGAYRYNYWK